MSLSNGRKSGASIREARKTEGEKMIEENNPKKYILRNLCRGYISTIFAMSFGRNVHDFDTMRVEYHHAIEEYFDIRYGDSEDKVKLNKILHSLQREISFPIPEHQGYGDVTITRDELTKRFNELVDFYGDALFEKLQERFESQRFRDMPRTEKVMKS